MSNFIALIDLLTTAKVDHQIRLSDHEKFNLPTELRNVEPGSDDYCVKMVRLKADTCNVIGYGFFYTEFYFNANDDLIKVGLWE
jgi:hypothetical protein